MQNVTQATSKSTGVTINKLTGTITMNGAALASGTTVAFTVTNGEVSDYDTVVINHQSGGALGAYDVAVHTLADGSFKVAVKNNTGGSLSEAPVLQYRVLRALYD